MSDPGSDLERLALATARELPARELAAFVDRLHRMLTWDCDGEPVAWGLARPRAELQALVQAALAASSTPGYLAGLLRGAAAMDDEWRRKRTVEIAWTGPTPPLSNLRRTQQALLEVIESARDELWLVSFAAYRVDSICAALVAAAERGCKVRVLLESDLESDGKLSSGGIASMPAEVRRVCDLYVWPREKRPLDERGRSGSMHAKCAVADGRLLFVGSANLTEFAFELNIELGVLVGAQDAAGHVQRQLRWLVESGRMALVP